MQFGIKFLGIENYNKVVSYRLTIHSNSEGKVGEEEAKVFIIAATIYYMYYFIS